MKRKVKRRMERTCRFINSATVMGRSDRVGEGSLGETEVGAVVKTGRSSVVVRCSRQEGHRVTAYMWIQVQGRDRAGLD